MKDTSKPPIEILSREQLIEMPESEINEYMARVEAILTKFEEERQKKQCKIPNWHFPLINLQRDHRTILHTKQIIKRLDAIKPGDKLYLVGDSKQLYPFFTKFKLPRRSGHSLHPYYIVAGASRLVEAEVLEIREDGTIVAKNMLSKEIYIGLRRSPDSLIFIKRHKGR